MNENVCKNHDYCYIEMSKENKNILKYNRGEKFMKIPFIISADTESLLQNKNPCQSNPEKSSTTKINKHTASGYSFFPHCLFDASQNKNKFYRVKDCMKIFSKDQKEHSTKIINYQKKEKILLTNEENKLHRKQKLCYECKEEFSTNDDNKKYHKVREHCHYSRKYRGAAHNVCNLRYKAPKQIFVVFHHGS